MTRGSACAFRPKSECEWFTFGSEDGQKTVSLRRQSVCELETKGEVMSVKKWVFTGCVAATLAACGGSNSAGSSINVQMIGLENLGPTSVYEGWVIVNGVAKTAGRFTVDDKGVMSQTNFPIASADIASTTAYVLTIEPKNDPDPGPTDTHLLAGNFDAARTQASLSVAHPSALGNDFTGATGRFFLATPTNGDADTNDQGIWWIDASSGSPAPGLSLPSLPRGWVYEGWVVVDGKPTSTGRFTNADGPDSDGGGPAAGTVAPAPPYPGQDFINPALKLPGGMAVISIEPEPDNSPAPFLLKPLLSNPIASSTGPANPQIMANQASKLNPTGTVTIVR